MPPIVQFEHRPGIHDLGWGHPRPSLLPVDEWVLAGRETAQAFGPDALTYGYAAGPGPLRAWLAEHLNRIEGGGTTPSQIFVTAGASHALALVTELLTRPGDTVLVDEPSYHLAFPVFRDHGLDVVGTGGDPAGALRSLRAAGKRVSLLYVVPTFTNPTGLSHSDDRRNALVALAQDEGLTVVEDDTYRELVYDRPAPTSLWRLSAHRREDSKNESRSGNDRRSGVVRLGSFSKTVAPGLRLGWINADPALVTRLAKLGYVHSGGGLNHHTAMTMATFGRSGAYEKHLRHVLRAYANQRDALISGLRGTLTVSRPAGGWFLWAQLPDGLTAARLLPVAERHGVSYLEGPMFYPAGRGGHDRIRLSFSHLPATELAEAATRLSAAIEEAR